MLDFQRKQKNRKRIYSIPVVLFLVIILLTVINGTWGAFQKARISRAALIESQEKLSILEKKQGKIEKDIDHIRTKTGIEEEIRIQYDVSREGERTLVIVEEEVPEPEVVEEKGFWSKVGSWFGN